MAGRFLPQRDRDFLERINKELIGDLKTNDDGIINQKIVIYKVSACTWLAIEEAVAAVAYILHKPARQLQQTELILR